MCFPSAATAPGSPPTIVEGGLMSCRPSKAWAYIIHFFWKCLRFRDPSLIPYAILSFYFDRHGAGCFGQHPLKDGGPAPGPCGRPAALAGVPTPTWWHQLASKARLPGSHGHAGKQKIGCLFIVSLFWFFYYYYLKATRVFLHHLSELSF